MRKSFFSQLGSGLLAIGLFAGLSAPALAAPAGIAAPALAKLQGSESGITLVHDGIKYKKRRYHRNSGHRVHRKWYGDNQFYSGKRHYRRHAGRHYRHYRPYRPYRYGGPGIYLGLGVPAYRYVQPRRYYGYGASSAHIAWCYDRYRSYRAWDNTYQPYHGPRRQCWSPYS